MGPTLLALLGFAGAAPPQVQPADCPSAERHVAEMLREIRAAAPDPRRVYELRDDFYRYVLDERAANPECVSDRLVPLLIDLVEDPDMRLSMVGAGVLAELGDEAAVALPAMRRAIPKAKAADQADVDRRHAAGEQAIIGGPFYEDTLMRLIDVVEYAHDFPPLWQDGLCTRIERRSSGKGLPDDVTVRVSLTATGASDCSKNALVEASTWRFTTEHRSMRDDELPPQLFESWKQLSEFRNSGIDAWQVCPVATRSQVRAGTRLADMQPVWIDEIEEDGRYDVALDSPNAATGLVEHVRFEFEAGKKIDAKQLRNVECWANNRPWYR